MSKRGIGMSGLRRTGLALGVVATGMVPLAVPAAADELPGKLKKQIEVMEKILDEVLVDSPNLLVAGQHVTNGLYISEFGVIFTCEASLLHHDGHGFDWDWSKFQIKRKDGNMVIEFPDDEDSTKDEKADSKKKLRTDEELYEGGKTEIEDALLDYGETLTALTENQWVAVAAFVEGGEFFKEKTRTLVLKARMADLQAYGAGRLSKDTMKSKVVSQEY